MLTCPIFQLFAVNAIELNTTYKNDVPTNFTSGKCEHEVTVVELLTSANTHGFIESLNCTYFLISPMTSEISYIYVMHSCSKFEFTL